MRLREVSVARVGERQGLLPAALSAFELRLVGLLHGRCFVENRRSCNYLDQDQRRCIRSAEPAFCVS